MLSPFPPSPHLRELVYCNYVKKALYKYSHLSLFMGLCEFPQRECPWTCCEREQDDGRSLEKHNYPHLALCVSAQLTEAERAGRCWDRRTMCIEQCAPVQCAPVLCAPVQCAPVQCAPVQCAPVQCTPVQCAPVQCAPVQCPPVQCAL
jgi:hypothetical protein